MRALKASESDFVSGGFNWNPIHWIEEGFDKVESGALAAIGGALGLAGVKKAEGLIKKFGKYGDDVAKDLDKAAKEGSKEIEWPALTGPDVGLV